MLNTIKTALLHEEWLLPLIGGVLLGLVYGAERRLRYRTERDMARQERDQLATGMVVALEGGQFRALPVRRGRVS
jgi:hypothetical protein